MTQLSQFFHRGKRKILIGIEQHPASLHESFFARLVLADGAVDLFLVGCSVSPSSLQVRRVQRGIGPEKVGIRRPEPAIVDQDPDGNARFPETGIPAATVRCLGNPAGSGGHRSIS
jgi:hypothetical protein